VSTSIRVRRYLDKQDVRYTTLTVDGELDDMLTNGNDNVNPEQIAKAIILKDQRGILMAVLPGPNELNVEALNRQLHRNLQPASNDDYQSIFADCEPGALPPLGEAYGMEAVVDDALLDQNLIYFVSGNSRELVRISGYDFQLLQSNAWFGNIFSQLDDDDIPQTSDEQTSDASINRDLKQQLQQPEQTPNLPAITLKINQLNNNPYAHGEDLARLLEKDPALSDQIIKYAQTNPFVKDTSVSTIRQVISRSLSYDLVMNLALGVSATRVFTLTPHGPLGVQAFWRHAAYSATLIYGLCQIIPRQHYLQPGTAVLCGLLHNIGLLLFGHRFAEEFTELNNAVSNSPDTPVTDIEQRMFGITHAGMGHWLTHYWLMPDELVTVTLEHHHGDYQGPYQDYVRLVCLTDKLLKQHGIGDAGDTEISDEFLQQLGLTRQQVLPVLEKTIQGSEQLDHMARQLAA
jgi:HD-like signal output (HDOD) protein/prolyl-tRNA editing enzyme YbaK/EbsC (Cys-tRNA(Pro) deacylase)